MIRCWDRHAVLGVARAGGIRRAGDRERALASAATAGRESRNGSDEHYADHAGGHHRTPERPGSTEPVEDPPADVSPAEMCDIGFGKCEVAWSWRDRQRGRGGRNRPEVREEVRALLAGSHLVESAAAFPLIDVASVQANEEKLVVG